MQNKIIMNFTSAAYQKTNYYVCVLFDEGTIRVGEWTSIIGVLELPPKYLETIRVTESNLTQLVTCGAIRVHLWVATLHDLEFNLI